MENLEKTDVPLSQTVSKLLMRGFLPAAFVVLISSYLFIQIKNVQTNQGMPGEALAAYQDLYPIDATANGKLSLNKEKFMSAVNFFSQNQSPKAIADLIYLGQGNNISLLLNPEEQKQYRKLLQMPLYKDLRAIDDHKNKKFEVYKDIVNGIGKTFAGTSIEIVLHDTRNPLKSVVAIQNPISGRRLGDSTTNFGIELIKDYSVVNSRSENYVSYPLTLKDGRKIKSSTIPLYDDDYGLIGFICLNIDISKMSEAEADDEYVDDFLKSFSSVFQNKKINELIENTRSI